jgi:hypothetical protein
MNSEFPVQSENGAASEKELNALQSVIAALSPLDEEARRRILDSVATFLRVDYPTRNVFARSQQSSISSTGKPSSAPFSEDTSMSSKDFLLEKQPRTDVERIACLAYYLTHYRSTPHFKTIDLSILNTEAAQTKFANAAYSANNAVKLGYLVPSTKGQRQLSAIGERFVRALPDRDAARDALASLRRRSKHKRGRNAPDDRDEA